MPEINSDEDEIVEMTDVDLNGHTALLVEFKNNKDISAKPIACASSLTVE